MTEREQKEVLQQLSHYPEARTAWKICFGLSSILTSSFSITDFVTRPRYGLGADDVGLS